MRSAGTGANVTWLESLLVPRVSHFLFKGHSISSVGLVFSNSQSQTKDASVPPSWPRSLVSLQQEEILMFRRKAMQSEDGHLGPRDRLLGHMPFSQAAKETNPAIFTFQLSMLRNSEEHNPVAKAAQTQGLCYGSPGRCRSYSLVGKDSHDPAVNY